MPALGMGDTLEGPTRGSERGAAAAGRGLTVQALHGQHVVPAEQRVAAQPLVVGRHERARRGRVRQAERVADLVRQHHEQVAPAAAAQRPALVPVEVRFAAARQEGVRQGAPCRRRGGSGGPRPATTPRPPPAPRTRRGNGWPLSAAESPSQLRPAEPKWGAGTAGLAAGYGRQGAERGARCSGVKGPGFQS